jgi:hypothetical protein
MADEQELPDSKPDASSGDDPAPQPPAKKAPAKAAKKAPTKKTAATGAPVKKAPAKKATPVKKAPAKKAPPPPPSAPVESAPTLAHTNGEGPTSSSAAKEAAAHAKDTVATSAPVLVPQPGPPRSNLPMVAAIVAGVLAILVVLLARRGSDD